MSTIREKIYDLSESKLDEEKVFRELISFLDEFVFKKTDELIIPMQLFEKMFNFDAHRGAVHPIASNIIKKFKNNNLRVSKVRNKYLVRIKKLKSRKK